MSSPLYPSYGLRELEIFFDSIYDAYSGVNNLFLRFLSGIVVLAILIIHLFLVIIPVGLVGTRILQKGFYVLFTDNSPSHLKLRYRSNRFQERFRE